MTIAEEASVTLARAPAHGDVATVQQKRRSKSVKRAQQKKGIHRPYVRACVGAHKCTHPIHDLRSARFARRGALRTCAWSGHVSGAQATTARNWYMRSLLSANGRLIESARAGATSRTTVVSLATKTSCVVVCKAIENPAIYRSRVFQRLETCSFIAAVASSPAFVSRASQG